MNNKVGFGKMIKKPETNISECLRYKIQLSYIQLKIFLYFFTSFKSSFIDFFDI